MGGLTRGLAILALLTLLLGLLFLALPDAYEGPMLYRINDAHAIRLVDGVGALLLLIGTSLAWTAALLWQRWQAQ
ncbi:MAG: hypothetical protein D6759_07750 [Chloroflexi bacterium]|nr:MAG: hypothetical protein D6759_07750 [Chloroflexota bacterium]